MEYPFVFGIVIENDVSIVKGTTGLMETDQDIRILDALFGEDEWKVLPTTLFPCL